ncbi:MAG: GDSL family lipase [Planctomycetes bacterium]|nr:GDSL family lipase [Planctomycetota bacterium]
MLNRTRMRMAFLVLVGSMAAAVIAEDAKNSAIVPAPRDAKWMARHESFNARVKQGNVDMLMIGDSITHGWEGGGREIWAKYYAPRHAVNLGIGGDRTQHVLWRLQNGNIEGISPKLAVIMIGTNNARDNTPEQTAEGVTAIVNLLREKLPNTKILLLAIFPRGANNEDGLRKKNEAVNAIIAKLDDGKMIHYLNINDKFLGADGTLSKEIMPDLLHPNGKGYQIWADAIEPSVKELMGE